MKARSPANRIAALLFATLIFCASALAATPDRQTTLAAADALIANPARADYRGWLKYLEFRVNFDAEKHGAESAEAVQSLERLAEWTARINADLDALSKLRGIQEWAYESPADGSGQPFKINIPTDYDNATSTPLSLYAHGYSGNHLEHATSWTEKTGTFEIGVLGRARGGFYHSLSEADVLDVLRYVRAHWNIDENRIRINGGSMGGMASYWLSARHPDIWASARPNCGFALESPLGNLIYTPVYAIHSRDDNVVSIMTDIGAMERLREMGGAVTYEKIDGFKHASWDYADGNARAGAWEREQVRIPSREIRNIFFTALDAAAARGWWAEVAKWGPEARPAHLILSARPDNSLYATLDNVEILRIDVASSPFDAAKPLRVSVGGGVAFSIPAPLPATILIGRDGDGWKSLAAMPVPAARLHTPGGAQSVYDGTPILIVYGTTGTAQENAAMKAAAIQASKSPNASWPSDDIDRSPSDGVSHYELLYGNLPVKADSEVTGADIASKNLVLIGSAAGNSLVAKMAGALPVALANGTVTISGTETIDAKGLALGLVHFNPLNPDRLILWFASEDPSFYRPGAILPQTLSNSPGVDMALMAVDSPRLVTARAFDSDWNWCSGRDNSPMVPASCEGEEGAARWLAGILSHAAGADFGARMRSFHQLKRLIPALRFTPGITRRADAALFFYNRPICTATLSGEELADVAKIVNASDVNSLQFFPAVNAAQLDAAARYRVSFTEDDIWALSQTGAIIGDSDWTGIDAQTVILQASED